MHLKNLDERFRLLTIRVEAIERRQQRQEDEARSRADMADSYLGALEDCVNQLSKRIEGMTKNDEPEKTVPV